MRDIGSDGPFLTKKSVSKQPNPQADTTHFAVKKTDLH